MGRVKIGTQYFLADRVVLKGNTIRLDNRELYLIGENLIQFCAKESTYIERVVERNNCLNKILIEGDSKYVVAENNMLVFGKAMSTSWNSNRFSGNTARDYYNQYKKQLSQKIEGRKRLKIHLQEKFSLLDIDSQNCDLLLELYIKGNIGSFHAKSDVIVKGIVHSGKCGNNLYVTYK